MNTETQNPERSQRIYRWVELYLKLVWALLTTVWLVLALAQLGRDVF